MSQLRHLRRVKGFIRPRICAGSLPPSLAVYFPTHLLHSTSQFLRDHENGIPFHSHSTAANFSTFVSKHFVIEESAILATLERHNLSAGLKITGSEFTIKICPFCKNVKGDASNMWKLYIARSSGAYFCHRCGAQGSWFDFKQKLSGSADSTSATPALGGSNPVRLPEQQIGRRMHANLFSKEDRFTPVLEYLTRERKLKISTLKMYEVGAGYFPFSQGGEVWDNLLCITYPWIIHSAEADQILGRNPIFKDGESLKDREWIVTRLKARCLSDKGKQKLVPTGGGWGLFGWHLVALDSSLKSIVLTEGEYDAMSVYQATGLPALSLPNGCGSLPPETVQLLERFERIILWMDNDVPGQQGAEKFIKKLGPARCLLVTPSRADAPAGCTEEELSKLPKDANEALCRGWNIPQMIERAAPPPHKQIVQFHELRDEIYREILNPGQMAGTSVRTFPTLNKLLKGHRKGELTVLTGPTGVGKTTFLSQLSLDLAQQDVRTLWGSFEIKNTRLVRKMMSQMAGFSLIDKIHLFDKVADDFAQIPLYFLRFYGSTRIEEILDAMEHAVYAYDVQHIILDNLQFMLSGQAVKVFDKFELQDTAILKLRAFASAKDVHITLVIHPRKEQEDSALSISSVFGSAKATQEADNVLILQRGQMGKSLDVKKNRYDGTLGSMYFRFDAASNKLIEITKDGDDVETFEPSPKASEHPPIQELEVEIKEQREEHVYTSEVGGTLTVSYTREATSQEKATGRKLAVSTSKATQSQPRQPAPPTQGEMAFGIFDDIITG